MFSIKIDINKNSITGITGSGGKTSLMFLLACELSKKGKVLVTTTTKIYEPLKNQYENMFLTEKKETVKGTGKNIDILGSKILNGKLISPNSEEIFKLKYKYDYILYEGDGAKEKIMKFWESYEPCILPYTDTVIGVGNIKALGLPFNENNVHRYNMYMDKNNKNFGREYIDESILKNYLTEGDFFRDFDGKKIVFLNGVETPAEIKTAVKFSQDIPYFMFGSVKEKKIYNPQEISAVVMASGEAKRFGANKLLTEINGTPMLEILLKKLVSLPFKNIFVTCKDKEILDLCRKYKVTPLENKNYFLGQSESIKLGASQIKDESIMFFTGDMPFLKEETILKLIEKYNSRITIPVVCCERFSPVIFPNKYKFALMGLSGDTGGREIIKTEKELNFIEFSDKNQFNDIDTKDDLTLKGGN